MGKKDRNDGVPDEEFHAFAEEALDDADAAVPQPALALDEDERLPWLESADDEDDFQPAGTGRLLRLAILGLVGVIAVLGGVWFFTRDAGPSADLADGSVIHSPGPYKEAPKDKGGTTFAGTGDSAFVVSEGKTMPARLDQSGTAPVPVPAASSGAPAEAADPGAVGVQVGAYKSLADAESGWARISGSTTALKGVKHRVVEGTADIGTVFRLQALAPSVEAAGTLCTTLKSGGIACQVKR